MQDGLTGRRTARLKGYPLQLTSLQYFWKPHRVREEDDDLDDLDNLLQSPPPPDSPPPVAHRRTILRDHCPPWKGTRR